MSVLPRDRQRGDLSFCLQQEPKAADIEACRLNDRELWATLVAEWGVVPAVAIN